MDIQTVPNKMLVEPSIQEQLGFLDEQSLIRFADKYVKEGRVISIVESELLGEFEIRGLIRSPEISTRLKSGSTWQQTPAGIWMNARIAELLGEHESAVMHWSKIIRSRAGDIEVAYISRARANAMLKLTDLAFSDVQSSIIECMDFGKLSRAAKMLSKLRVQSAPPALRRIRVALLFPTTVDLIAPVFQAVCFKYGIDVELYLGPLDTVNQEILAEDSQLYRFSPDVIIIGTKPFDERIRALNVNSATLVQEIVGEYKALWAAISRRCNALVIQHNLDASHYESLGNYAASSSIGRLAVIEAINRELFVSATSSSVVISDVHTVASRFGKSKWFDSQNWYRAMQHPSPDAIPFLVQRDVALIRTRQGLSKKVLVVDLDNTLWGGVVGEDGLDGLEIGPSTPLGMAYWDIQKYIAELKERGILLAVCSKNNWDDARAPFLGRDGMFLKLEDFVAFKANWNDKPSNVQAIAHELGLGLDSFVFLDDNPAERDLMRSALPAVSVPEVTNDVSSFIDALDRHAYFETVSISQEDSSRHKSYQSNVRREEFKAIHKNLYDYLYGLEMRSEVKPFGNDNIARVVQLIGKTNQFNLTTRRYTEAQIRQMFEDPSIWTAAFWLRDKFGDNGLVGLLIAKPMHGSLDCWDIDTWLMSCRVLGRQFEDYMLDSLTTAALSKGIRKLRGTYIATSKNQMVATLYEKLGFSQESPSGDRVFWLELSMDRPRLCKHIA